MRRTFLKTKKTKDDIESRYAKLKYFQPNYYFGIALGLMLTISGIVIYFIKNSLIALIPIIVGIIVVLICIWGIALCKLYERKHKSNSK